MAGKDFIVAIELGSSKITGIAGKKNGDGSIRVDACVTEDSSSFIQKGVIYNLNKTAQALTSIINQLEAQLDAEIVRTYVGIGGKSVRTVKNTVTKHLDDDQNTITEEIVNQINDENIATPFIDMDILDVVPQEYRVGNFFQLDPIGMIGNNIEGRFQNILARSYVKSNLMKSFKQANIEVLDTITAPLALADVLLSDSEKRSGCALVDIGADTTTVSVYKKGILSYLAVIPLGGNDITRDIATLQMEEQEAEQIKIDYGSTIISEEKEGEDPLLITLADGRSIKESDLNNIIEARMEEIMANVWNQILLSGYASQLLAGVVFTGGVTNTRGLEETFQKRVQAEKGKIEKVKIMKYPIIGISDDDSSIIERNGQYNTILALLHAGEYNCCQSKAPEPMDALTKEAEEQEKIRRAETEAEAKKAAAERAAAAAEAEQKKKEKGGFMKKFKKGVEGIGDLFAGDQEVTDK